MGNNNQSVETPVFKGTSTASTETQHPQVHVLNADPVIEMLNRKSNVSAQELDSLKSTKAGNRDILVGGDINFVDAGGYDRSRPKTIIDLNTHLVYAWVSADSLQKSGTFSIGWFPVKSTNDGGANIPDHYFNQDGFIVRADSYLSWTTREFANKARDRDSELLRKQLESVKAEFIEGKSGGVNQQFSIT